MTLIPTRVPTGEPVTVDALKAHLRITHASEDALLGELIAAARQTVEREAGVACLDQGFRLLLDALPGHGLVRLPVHPVGQVTAITVYDAEGNPSDIDVPTTVLDGYAVPPRLQFRQLPPTGRCINGIEIDFDAGFGSTAAEVPDTLKRAILLAAAHWYEFRAELAASDQPAAYPAGFHGLLTPWRRMRL